MGSSEKFGYEQSALIQAICEFRFSPSNPISKDWDGKWYSRLLNELGKDYEMEPQQHVPLFIPQKAVDDVKKYKDFSLNRMIYKKQNTKEALHLSPGSLAIYCDDEHDDWDSFKKQIGHAFNCLLKTITPFNLDRIGMRYLYRLHRKDRSEPLRTWICSGNLIPNRVLDQYRAFSYHCEIPKDAAAKMIVNLFEENNNERKPIILDLDFIFEKKILNDRVLIEKELDKLHSALFQELDQIINPSLKKYLYLNH